MEDGVKLDARCAGIPSDCNHPSFLCICILNIIILADPEESGNITSALQNVAFVDQKSHFPARCFPTMGRRSRSAGRSDALRTTRAPGFNSKTQFQARDRVLGRRSLIRSRTGSRSEGPSGGRSGVPWKPPILGPRSVRRDPVDLAQGGFCIHPVA